MGRRYSIDGQGLNTAAKSILGLVSAATVRPRLYDLTVGSPAAVADNYGEYALQRFTAAGTATAVTPTPLDPADPAALSSAGENHTAEPTYTAGAILLRFALNQRATFRWVASPGAELVLPATAANGIGLQSLATSAAVIMDAVIHFEE